MTKLSFIGLKNWFTVDGELYRYWNSADAYYVEERPLPAFIPVNKVQGEWDGKLFDTQHVFFEGWFLQFTINESFVHSFSDIKSCEYVEVFDSENESEGITLNVDVSENLELTIERQDSGSIYLVTMTYRTKKVIVNKAEPIINDNKISFTSQVEIWFEDLYQSSSFTNPRFANLTTTLIAVFDSPNLTAYALVDGVWIQQGSAYNATAYGDARIARLSSNEVVLVGSGSVIITKFSFSGVSWSTVGSSLNLGQIDANVRVAKVFNDTIVVAYGDDSLVIDTFEFQTSNWVNLNNRIKTIFYTNYFPEIVEVNSYEFAITSNQDGSERRLIKYHIPSTKWEIDSEVPVLFDSNVTLSKLDSSEVVMIDDSTKKLQVVNFSTLEVSENSIIIDGIQNPSIVAIDYFQVVLNDGGNSRLSTYEFGLGGADYFTDFEVLNTFELPENIFVDFQNGEKKLYKSVLREKISMLLYLPTDSAEQFESWLVGQNGGIITKNISGINKEITPVYLKDFERQPSGENYNRIVVNYIITENESIFDIKTPTIATLTFGSSTYNSAYILRELTLQETKTIVELHNGINKVASTTRKTGYTYIGFFDEDTVADLLNKYQLEDLLQVSGSSLAITEMLERPPIQVSDIDSNLQQVQVECITSIVKTTFDIQTPTIATLTFGSNTYNSAYILRELTLQETKTEVTLNDGTKKVASTTRKTGYTYTGFFDKETVADLLNKYQLEALIQVSGSGVSITEILERPDIEVSDIDSNLQQVKLECITSIVKTTFGIETPTVATLTLGATPFNSAYDLTELTLQTQNTEVVFPDGTNKVGATVSKTGYTYTGFFDKDTVADLLEKYQQETNIQVSGTALALTTIIERPPIELSDIDDNLQQARANCVTNVVITYFNLNPLGTHDLRIIRTKQDIVDVTYSTDFPVKIMPEAAEIDTVLDQDGINLTTKSITMDVTQLTFYVNEATAKAIKRNFELGGTVTLDTVPVLEQREVTPTELAPDLWEVIVACKTDSTLYYPDSP